MCMWIVELLLPYHPGGKESRPISGRVKDIAEFVMACVMDKVVSSMCNNYYAFITRSTMYLMLA